jgi:hypothetical protein
VCSAWCSDISTSPSEIGSGEAVGGSARSTGQKGRSGCRMRSVVRGGWNAGSLSSAVLRRAVCGGAMCGLVRRRRGAKRDGARSRWKMGEGVSPLRKGWIWGGGGGAGGGVAQGGGAGAPEAPHDARLWPSAGGKYPADGVGLCRKAGGGAGERKGEYSGGGAGPCHDIVRWRLDRGVHDHEPGGSNGDDGALSGHNMPLAVKFSGVPGAEKGEGG